MFDRGIIADGKKEVRKDELSGRKRSSEYAVANDSDNRPYCGILRYSEMSIWMLCWIFQRGANHSSVFNKFGKINPIHDPCSIYNVPVVVPASSDKSSLKLAMRCAET